MTRVRATVAAVALTTFGAPLVWAQQAQAAPTWCRAWHVSGQTWYAYQSNGYSLLFTLKSTPGSERFSGFARHSRGDVSLGGTPSQLLRGSVSSDGVGRVVMNINWSNGQSGQYIGSVVNVRQTPSGTLTAGLQGTSVDTTGTGSGGVFRWEADGFSSGIGTSERYYWPLFCPKAYVVRYPQSGPVTTTTVAKPAKPVNSSKPKQLAKRVTTLPSTTVPPPAPAAAAVPAVGRVTAVDDVDVYNGPGGTFNVVAVMAAGASANVLARHPDGWCLLDGLGPAGTAWVAEDHLTPRRCGAG